MFLTEKKTLAEWHLLLDKLAQQIEVAMQAAPKQIAATILIDVRDRIEDSAELAEERTKLAVALETLQDSMLLQMEMGLQLTAFERSLGLTDLADCLAQTQRMAGFADLATAGLRRSTDVGNAIEHKKLELARLDDFLPDEAMLAIPVVTREEMGYFRGWGQAIAQKADELEALLRSGRRKHAYAFTLTEATATVINRLFDVQVTKQDDASKDTQADADK